jgi:hypothetical protein
MMTLHDLLILNLALQVFDGLFSYQAFSLGAAEANIYGLLYKKILACALLLLVFAFRHRLPSLTQRGLVVTASVYARTCMNRKLPTLYIVITIRPSMNSGL